MQRCHVDDAAQHTLDAFTGTAVTAVPVNALEMTTSLAVIYRFGRRSTLCLVNLESSASPTEGTTSAKFSIRLQVLSRNLPTTHFHSVVMLRSGEQSCNTSLLKFHVF